MQHNIELTYGYTDKKGVTHKDVTFGYRVTVGDLVMLDNNPMAQNQTQREQLVRRQMITKFGTLSLPVPLNVLAALDTMDDDRMRIGADHYLQITRDGRQAEYRNNDEVKLIFGVEIDGVRYDVVKFGRRLTVADNIEADNRNLGNGIARICFQICKQIVELSDSETGIKLEGPIESEKLSGMDSEDLQVLRFAGEFFRLAPSASGKDLQGESGEVSGSSGEANGVDGDGDNTAAD